jgi:hypothetical protein
LDQKFLVFSTSFADALYGLSIIRICSMNTARKDLLLNIFAASRGAHISRKELERGLARYRQQFQNARDLYSTTTSKLEELQQVADKARNDMQSAQDGMGKTYDSLQTMDLTGANSARNRGDVRTYLVDGKEYHVDKSDANDIRMTPWKEYKHMKDEDEECVDCADAADASDMDVDEIADAADAFALMCE